MHQKVGRCAAACDAACGPAGHMSSNFSQNETARAFVCEAHLAGGYDYLVERELYDDAIALGEPRCEENCDCHRACGAGCAEAALGQKEHGVNSSALAIEYYPSCLENCTSRCLPTHHEVCHNYTETISNSPANFFSGFLKTVSTGSRFFALDHTHCMLPNLTSTHSFIFLHHFQNFGGQ